VADSTQHFPQNTGFIERTIVVDGDSRPVWVFVPEDYHPGRKYPAILFLHGLWEKGNGGTNVLSAGLGPVIAQDPEHWPFITIFPQSPGDWKGPERERLAMIALDDAQRHWSIDSDRVILAGLSYGGLGVWEIGAKHPDRFAALVPVSGHQAPEWVERLVTFPIWAFASHDDPWVKSDNSVEMCRAIDACGGHARLTEFEGSSHDCWELAVSESDLVSWMLKQKREPVQRATTVVGTPQPLRRPTNSAASTVLPSRMTQPGRLRPFTTPVITPPSPQLNVSVDTR
jgi:predicted peptidase